MSATAAERAFAGRFDASRSEREAREPAWLGRLREEAFSAFAAQGLPTTRLEDWRFTSLAALAKLELGTVADRDDAAPTSGAELLALGPAHRMVFVNGRISPALSSLGALPAGCRVAPLSEVIATDPRAVERVLASAADAKKRPVVALNSALFADGVFVELSDGAVLDRPVHALFLQSGAGAPIASHVRSLISAGAGSRGLVVEHHAGTNSGSDLTDAVTEIRLGETGRSSTCSYRSCLARAICSRRSYPGRTPEVAWACTRSRSAPGSPASSSKRASRASARSSR